MRRKYISRKQFWKGGVIMIILLFHWTNSVAQADPLAPVVNEVVEAKQSIYNFLEIFVKILFPLMLMSGIVMVWTQQGTKFAYGMIVFAVIYYAFQIALSI